MSMIVSRLAIFTESLWICCCQVTKICGSWYGFTIASSARGPCNFHGVQVVKVGVQLRVHQDRGVEEDGEGQVEVEREAGEDQRETLMCDCADEMGLMNDLSQ